MLLDPFANAPPSPLPNILPPPKHQHSFSAQSAVFGGGQAQKQMNQDYFLDEVGEGRRSLTDRKEVKLCLSVDSFEGMLMATILIQENKQNVKLITVRSQEQKHVIQVRLQGWKEDVLSFNSSTPKQQLLQGRSRQYFFLHPFPQHTPIHPHTFHDYALKCINSLVLGQGKTAMVDFGRFGQFVGSRMRAVGAMLQSKNVSIYYLNNNLLILQQTTDQLHKMDPQHKDRRLTHPAITPLSNTIYLRFEQVCAHIFQQDPNNAENLIDTNKSILLNNLTDRVCNVKVLLNVKDKITLDYLIEFHSSKAVIGFLQVAHQCQLWAGIEHIDGNALSTPQENITINELERLTKGGQQYQSRGKKSRRNCQSLEYEVEEAEVVTLERVNEILKREDLLALKEIWASYLMNRIQQICMNWQVYGRLYKQPLETFTLVTRYKMAKMRLAFKDKLKAEGGSLYENIYPNITLLLNVLSKKLEIPRLSEESLGSQEQLQAMRKHLNIQQNIADRIFYYFIAEQQDRACSVNVIHEKPMPMSEYIASCHNFAQRPQHWNHAFTSLIHILRPTDPNGKEYFENIQFQRLVEHRCIGCSTFFQEAQNIYDELVNGFPVRVVGSVHKLRESEALLKDEICGLLNSGGGVILMDCVRVYREIRPQGVLMDQKDKEECEQRIYSYISQFHPRLEVKSHVLVSFVPVLPPTNSGHMARYSGVHAILKDNYCYLKKEELCTRYVTRVRVVPAEPCLVYFWFVPPRPQEQEMRKYCIRLENNMLVQTGTLAMDKLIKRRMRQFYQQHDALCPPPLLLAHDCCEPEQGTPLPDIPRTDKKPRRAANVENQYSYLSMLICKHENEESLRGYLKKGRLNFELRVLFRERGFKPARNTFALYHNNKFEEVYFEIKKEHYRFDNREVLAINVTSFLKLDQRNEHHPFSPNHPPLLDALAEFSQEYPEETLKAFRFRASPTKSEYYLLTQSKTSNLFLYYLLNHRGERAVFKNPYLLDKLTAPEREQRMVLEHELRGRNDFLYERQSGQGEGEEGPEEPDWYSFWEQEFDRQQCAAGREGNLLK